MHVRMVSVDLEMVAKEAESSVPNMRSFIRGADALCDQDGDDHLPATY